MKKKKQYHRRAFTLRFYAYLKVGDATRGFTLEVSYSWVFSLLGRRTLVTLFRGTSRLETGTQSTPRFRSCAQTFPGIERTLLIYDISSLIQQN